MKLSLLFFFALLAVSGYFLYKYQSKIFLLLAGEDQSYTSCPCCCANAKNTEPKMQCLYYDKGDRISVYKNRDKKITDCSNFSCSKPITYTYCTE